MAKEQRGRKVKLTWYPIKAPEYFGNVIVGETPVKKFGSVENRVVTIPLNIITNSIKHVFINVSLRITGVVDGVAQTIYWGHEISRDRIARLVRKRTSRIDVIQDLETKDGVKLRVKSLVITNGRANTSVKSVIRKEMASFMASYLPTKKLEEFLKDVFGDVIQKQAHARLMKIFPIKHVEIRKVEVLKPY